MLSSTFSRYPPCPSAGKKLLYTQSDDSKYTEVYEILTPSSPSSLDRWGPSGIVLSVAARH